jgi:hypothetical protein
MTGHLLAWGILALLVTSGCLGINDSDASEEEKQRTSRNGTAREPGRDGGSGALPDGKLHLFPVSASPEGTLNAFRFPIPTDVLAPRSHSPDVLLLSLEGAFLGDESKLSSISSWAILGAAKTGNTLTFNGGAYDTTLSLESTLLTPIVTRTTFTPKLEPFITTFGFLEHRDGDDLSLIIAVRSQTPAELTLGLRVMGAQEREDRERERPDRSTFIDTWSKAEKQPHERVATAQGFRLAIYEEIRYGLVAVGMARQLIASNDVHIDNRMPTNLYPYIGARDITLSTRLESETGFTAAFALHYTSQSTGRWAIDIAAHGKAIHMRSVNLPDPTGLNDVIVGFPFAFMQQEGKGGSSVELFTQQASLDDVEFVFFDAIQLGASPHTLFGLSTKPESYSAMGIVGNIPPATMQRSSTGWALDFGGGAPIVMQSPVTLPSATL